MKSFGVHLFLLAFLAPIAFLTVEAFTETYYNYGINYKGLAVNIPAPIDKVIPLLRAAEIMNVRIYDADPDILRAFSGTGLAIVVGLPNDYLENVASSADNAMVWVKENVLAYLPNTHIRGITVGNEVLGSSENKMSGYLVDAVKNVYNAVNKLNLSDVVQITTAHSSAVFGNSFPPSSSVFRADIVQYMKPLLEFFSQIGSPFCLNAYPYFVYAKNRQLDINYALFQPTQGEYDPKTKLHYDNMLDVIIDAAYAASENAGFKDMKVIVTETGWPWDEEADETGATTDNARTYNYNLRKKLAKMEGTPLRPKNVVKAFFYAMFDAPGPTSMRNFGLFKADGTLAYDMGFPGLQFSYANSSHTKGTTLVPASSPTPSRSPASNKWPGPPPPLAGKKPIRIGLVVGSAFAALIFTLILIWVSLRIIRKWVTTKEEGRRKREDDWEKSLDLATNFPTRFKYEDLKTATEDFNKRIGRGGFGSVFEGTIGNGTKIAVKRLDPLGQGRKEFLAEVKTIGGIHHVNLVRLMGFCIENSNRLLVYEHMSNGSLDKWIFNKDSSRTLKWAIRKKIIFDISKGLAYLHDDCQMRIAHLDVKPENILLNDSYNAKLSDFGLARPIDRSQNHVITQMRGTRGYLAPEWLSRRITEKVDVYSFGVVVLEVICGRRNIDFSRPDEDDCWLLPKLKVKAEKNQLLDLVDKEIEGIQLDEEEVIKMMRIAIWCSQSDHQKRPSMYMVLKVMEGLMPMEPISDYSFLTSIVVEAPTEVVMIPSSSRSASVLSGPR